jgi:putative SOS response-associated peptidase YedK
LLRPNTGSRIARLFDIQRAIRRVHHQAWFKDAWKWGQRCLVVTNGFYEWKKVDPKSKIKQAYAVDMASSDEMVMAGLWSKWRDPASGEEILSCTVLTCAPNDAMAEKHPRSLVRTCQTSRRKAGMTSHPKRSRDPNQLANAPAL